MAESVLIVTTNDCPGQRVTQVLGAIYGTSAKSRNAVGNMIGGLRQAFGGDQAGYAKLINETRDAAIAELAQRAANVGANAVLGMRFESDQLTTDKGLPINVVVAYGTAVVLE